MSVLIDRTPPITRITLNRPDTHNAFDETLIAQLTEAFESLREDEATRVVVLQGAGKSFCAGADLNWMGKMVDYTFAENLEDARRLARMFEAIDHCPKPVVGRVHGASMGGGAGLVAVCDVAIATPDARFAFSEVKLGLIPAVIAPYDCILVTAGAPPKVPQPLLDQLNPDGGKLLLPLGSRQYQRLTRITKHGTRLRAKTFGECMFVPLVGKYGWKSEELEG